MADKPRDNKFKFFGERQQPAICQPDKSSAPYAADKERRRSDDHPETILKNPHTTRTSTAIINNKRQFPAVRNKSVNDRYNPLMQNKSVIEKYRRPPRVSGYSKKKMLNVEQDGQEIYINFDKELFTRSHKKALREPNFNVELVDASMASFEANSLSQYKIVLPENRSGADQTMTFKFRYNTINGNQMEHSETIVNPSIS